MLDIGWQEMALTGVVALLVLGPKELPGLMRTAGQMVRKARLIARDFQLGLEEMADEAELKELQDKAYKQATAIEPAIKVEEAVTPAAPVVAADEGKGPA